MRFDEPMFKRTTSSLKNFFSLASYTHMCERCDPPIRVMGTAGPSPKTVKNGAENMTSCVYNDGHRDTVMTIARPRTTHERVLRPAGALEVKTAGNNTVFRLCRPYTAVSVVRPPAH